MTSALRVYLEQQLGTVERLAAQKQQEGVFYQQVAFDIRELLLADGGPEC